MKSHLKPALLITSLLLSSHLFAQQTPNAATPPAKTATTIVAGGCFWCVEADFEKLPGVLAAESGYIGGKTPNPTYEQVSAGGTGHTEGVRITYDPAVVSYPQLLAHFWKNVDPTVKDRQFCDVGSQYRSALFYQNDYEKKAIEASKDAILKAGGIKKIYTEVAPTTAFYPAEQYHQDYYKKNPVRYKFYRSSCGRDQRLAEIWQQPSN
jgi:peptide-methionine (S)-S-oxide reductase